MMRNTTVMWTRIFMSVFSYGQSTVVNQDRFRRLLEGHEINQNKEMKWLFSVPRLREPDITISYKEWRCLCGLTSTGLSIHWLKSSLSWTLTRWEFPQFSSVTPLFLAFSWPILCLMDFVFNYIAEGHSVFIIRFYISLIWSIMCHLRNLLYIFHLFLIF